jgi:hypothetical protein
MLKVMRVWVTDSKGGLMPNIKDLHWARIKRRAEKHGQEAVWEAWSNLAEEKFENWLANLAEKRASSTSTNKATFSVQRVDGPPKPLTLVRPHERLRARGGGPPQAALCQPHKKAASAMGIGKYVVGVEEEHIHAFIIEYLHQRSSGLVAHRAAQANLSPMAAVYARNNNDTNDGRDSVDENEAWAAAGGEAQPSSPSNSKRKLPPLKGKGASAEQGSEANLDFLAVNDRLDYLPERLLGSLELPKPAPTLTYILNNDNTTASSFRHRQMLDCKLTRVVQQLWVMRCKHMQVPTGKALSHTPLPPSHIPPFHLLTYPPHNRPLHTSSHSFAHAFVHSPPPHLCSPLTSLPRAAPPPPCRSKRPADH